MKEAWWRLVLARVASAVEEGTDGFRDLSYYGVMLAFLVTGLGEDSIEVRIAFLISMGLDEDNIEVAESDSGYTVMKCDAAVVFRRKLLLFCTTVVRTGRTWLFGATGMQPAASQHRQSASSYSVSFCKL